MALKSFQKHNLWNSLFQSSGSQSIFQGSRSASLEFARNANSWNPSQSHYIRILGRSSLLLKSPLKNHCFGGVQDQSSLGSHQSQQLGFQVKSVLVVVVNTMKWLFVTNKIESVLRVFLKKKFYCANMEKVTSYHFSLCSACFGIYFFITLLLNI